MDRRATRATCEPKLKKWRNKSIKSTLKKFIIFFKKIFFLYLEKWNFLDPSLKYFSYFSYISDGTFRTETFRAQTYFEQISHIFPKINFSYIPGGNFSSCRNKKIIIFFQKRFFLCFSEWNFLAPNLKNSYIFSKNIFWCFSRELCKPGKQKKSNLKKFLPTFGDDCWWRRKIRKNPCSRMTAD